MIDCCVTETKTENSKTRNLYWYYEKFLKVFKTPRKKKKVLTILFRLVVLFFIRTNYWLRKWWDSFIESLKLPPLSFPAEINVLIQLCCLSRPGKSICLSYWFLKWLQSSYVDILDDVYTLMISSYRFNNTTLVSLITSHKR